MRATRAIDALHGVVPLKFYPNWRGRGQGEMTSIRGTIWHDTVTPYPPQGRWTVQGCMDLLAHGREGLRGMLSQFGMEPDGTWWVIGDGKGWHNGYGLWGNNALGIEVMAGSTVVSPPQIWTPAQFESAAKGTAAIARAGVHPVSAVQGHREQDRRKQDPYGVDMNRGRERVRLYVAGNAAPAPVPEEDEMVYLFWSEGVVRSSDGHSPSVHGLHPNRIAYIEKHLRHKWLPDAPGGRGAKHEMAWPAAIAK